MELQRLEMGKEGCRSHVAHSCTIKYRWGLGARMLGIDEEERTTLWKLKGNGRMRGGGTMEEGRLNMRLAHSCTGVDRTDFWAEVWEIEDMTLVEGFEIL